MTLVAHLSFVLNVLSIGIYWKPATLLMTGLVIHVRYRVIIGAYLIVVYQLMLHTKYQGSRLGGFRQEDFFLCFHYMLLNVKKKV